MEWYVSWVKAMPLFAAFVQFFIFGTLGELVGILAARRKPSNNALEWVLKALVWGLLGICIKYAFKGFEGFIEKLVHAQMLPSFCIDVLVINAFSRSFFTNILFGPMLMFAHRTTDNWITGSKGYANVDKSLWTLLWFWVPAHTVVFSLPSEYQIGLAALLSVALGLIMGFTKRAK